MNSVDNQQKMPLPFTEKGRYTGKITTEILINKKTMSLYIRSEGARLSLETFTEPYREDFINRFDSNTVKTIPEVIQLQEVFGDAETVKNYGSGKTKTLEETEPYVQRDSTRPYTGNPFTGFMIWDKESKRIIGRISAGTCYAPGDSQTGLIIHAEERGKKKGLEAILLVAGIMVALWKGKFKVGDDEKLPVKRFTATTRDDNESMIKLITSLGMGRIRELTPEENYSDDPRSLYGIDAEKIKELLEKGLTNPRNYSAKVRDF